MDDATENSLPGIALPAMQIIEHVDLNATDARVITDKIRGSMGDLMELIGRAWIGRVWLALGYQSWADYIKGEFDRAPLHLPRDERRAVAALLRGQGMSTRAIGAAAGVDQKTVVNDLATEENSSVVPPDKIIGLDNKERPAHPPKPKPKPDVPKPAELTDDQIAELHRIADAIHEGRPWQEGLDTYEPPPDWWAPDWWQALGDTDRDNLVALVQASAAVQEAADNLVGADFLDGAAHVEAEILQPVRDRLTAAIATLTRLVGQQ